MGVLLDIRDYTSAYEGMLVMAGLPYMYHGKLYNVVAAVMNGHIKGLVPKMFILIMVSFMKEDSLQKVLKKKCDC